MSEAHMSEIAATYHGTVKWRRVKTTAPFTLSYVDITKLKTSKT